VSGFARSIRSPAQPCCAPAESWVGAKRASSTNRLSARLTRFDPAKRLRTSGVVHERAGDPEPPAHAQAVGTERRAGTVGEPELLEQRRGGRARGGPGRLVQAGVVDEVLLSRLAGRVAAALGRHADPAADLVRATRSAITAAATVPPTSFRSAQARTLPQRRT